MLLLPWQCDCPVLILHKKMIVLGDLLLKHSPEVFFLGSEYLLATKGSGGNIIKKIGNVKSFVIPDKWKNYSNGFRQKTINHWLWTLGKLLYRTVLFLLFYKFTNIERI